MATLQDLQKQYPNIPADVLQNISDAMTAAAPYNWADLMGYANGDQNALTLKSQEDRGQLANGQYTTNEQALQGIALNGRPTIEAQKDYLDTLMNAQKGTADPFTYLAKERAFGQTGFLGNFLNQAIENATGQSVARLQAQPSLTNQQLATDLVNAAQGKPISPLSANFLSRMLGVPLKGGTASTVGAQEQPQPGSTQTVGKPGALDVNGLVGQLVDRLHQSAPAGFMAGLGSGMLPYGGALPGWQASLQEFSRMNPSQQQALTDLVQASGGENPADFKAGMEAAAPEFGKTGFASFGKSEV